MAAPAVQRGVGEAVSYRPITITGEDIIGWDGTDRTGALKELGVLMPKKATWAATCAMTFQVDLDFVLRHDLLDEANYKSHYRDSPQYMVYHEEGKQAFLAGRDESNPYHREENVNIRLRAYPWYDGYRETQAATMEAKYLLTMMQKEIRAVIAKYGLTVEDCDEYPASYSYAKTPEGYHVKLT